ncbi:secreted protein [Candidatus Thiomargarita nelsonii]|uniref:Secreted protein n=1 Tax=Candidatus Thiomargarita nelsonii TaxID=1003181 RepID=A0A176S2G2_9GAMM|nr:secreted protein [Candidatus Thiomargarita nelsonii]
MTKKYFMAIISLFVFLILMGNVPAPWWACDGKNEGDSCTAAGYTCSILRRGVCRQQEKNCKDDPQTKINECLWCSK